MTEINEVWLKCPKCQEEFNKLVRHNGQEMCLECKTGIVKQEEFEREKKFRERNPVRKKTVKKVNIDKYGEDISPRDDSYDSVWAED